MAAQPIELVYVGYRSEELRQVLDAGVRTFLVDREWRGKERRQLGQDTEIDAASREDLAAATALPGARVWCRINSFGNQTPQEVEEAIEVGVGPPGHIEPLPGAGGPGPVYPPRRPPLRAGSGRLLS